VVQASVAESTIGMSRPERHHASIMEFENFSSDVLDARARQHDRRRL
jgi:hypothetical protein